MICSAFYEKNNILGESNCLFGIMFDFVPTGAILIYVL